MRLPPALLSLLPSPRPEPEVLIVPGDRFFVRQISLAEDAPAETQIELALEGLAPFAATQLYFGHVSASDGRSALTYAAYRRRFTAEENESWAHAACVVPDFLALLGLRPGTGGIVIHEGETALTGLAWREGEELPEAVLVRDRATSDSQLLAGELRHRAGLDDGALLKVVSGPITATDGDDLQLALGGEQAFTLDKKLIDHADVRDDDFLAARRQSAKRDEWLWRVLLAGAALLVLGLGLDVMGGLLRWRAGARAAQVEAQAEDVQRIETAQELAARIGQLSETRLMAFEMLELTNTVRPDSIVFQRAATREKNQLEIEAQTANAADVGAYENALKALPAVTAAAARDVRTREGVTSFLLALTFDPKILKSGPAAPEAVTPAVPVPEAATPDLQLPDLEGAQ